MRALRPLLILAIAFPFGSVQASPPTPAPCSTPEYAQFDFWLGDWDVTVPGGKPAGHNLVTKEYAAAVVKGPGPVAAAPIGSASTPTTRRARSGTRPG